MACDIPLQQFIAEPTLHKKKLTDVHDKTELTDLQAAKIQKAEDIGRTAWQKGSTQEGNIKVKLAQVQTCMQIAAKPMSDSARAHVT